MGYIVCQFVPGLTQRHIDWVSILFTRGHFDSPIVLIHGFGWWKEAEITEENPWQHWEYSHFRPEKYFQIGLPLSHC